MPLGSVSWRCSMWAVQGASSCHLPCSYLLSHALCGPSLVAKRVQFCGGGAAKYQPAYYTWLLANGLNLSLAKRLHNSVSARLIHTDMQAILGPPPRTSHALRRYLLPASPLCGLSLGHLSNTCWLMLSFLLVNIEVHFGLSTQKQLMQSLLSWYPSQVLCQLPPPISHGESLFPLLVWVALSQLRSGICLSHMDYRARFGIAGSSLFGLQALESNCHLRRFLSCNSHPFGTPGFVEGDRLR